MESRLSKWRYSLRGLFAVITVVCGALGLIAWLQLLGAVLVLGCISFVVAIVGYQRRSYAMGSIAVLGLLVFAAIWFTDFSAAIHASIRVIVQVQVSVIDRSTKEPLPFEVAVRQEYHGFAWNEELTWKQSPSGRLECPGDYSGGESWSLLELSRPRRRVLPLEHLVLHEHSPGYEPVMVSLADALQKKEWPRDQMPLPDVVIELRKSE